MQTKILPKFGLVLFFVITASIFGFEAVKAFKVPLEAGLGQTCDTSTPCDSRFSCSGGKCVQCVDAYGCNESLGESCVNSVCTLPGGNNISDLCAKGDNCKSGLVCGARGVCQEAGGEPASGASESETGETGGEENWWGIDLTIEDVGNIINGLACWLTRIATAIMVIFLILAGLRFMNARGNPTAYQAAIKNFQQVLIGILVIMAVYVIIATVANAVDITDFSLIPLVC